MECKATKKVLYNLETINDLLKIHKACDIIKEVQRELDWYAEMADWHYPQQESVSHFQNLLYSSRIDAVLQDYDMPVDELSKLCCTRWLSSDHICWMNEMLNKASGETYCVFMNYVFMKYLTDYVMDDAYHRIQANGQLADILVTKFSELLEQMELIENSSHLEKDLSKGGSGGI